MTKTAHLTIARVSVKSSSNHAYWLTILHIGNFRNIPLFDISVEGGNLIKHCRKTKGRLHSQSTRKKKGRRKNPDQNSVTAKPRKTFFKLHASRHQPKPPPQWTFLNHKSKSDIFHTNPYVSQRTRTCTNHHHKTYIRFISPANKAPNLHTKPHNVQ